MSKNVYDLIVAIVSGVEVIGQGIFVFLGVSGSMDAKIATACSGSVTIVGGAVLGVCSRFIKETK